MRSPASLFAITCFPVCLEKKNHDGRQAFAFRGLHLAFAGLQLASSVKRPKTEGKLVGEAACPLKSKTLRRCTQPPKSPKRHRDSRSAHGEHDAKVQKDPRRIISSRLERVVYQPPTLHRGPDARSKGRFAPGGMGRMAGWEMLREP